MLVGATGLTRAGGQSAGGKRVARLATVPTKTGVRATTTLVHGKGTPETPSAIDFHGLGATKRDLVSRGGAREGERTGKGARRRLGGVLGSGAGCSSLVLLDRDGSCHIG